jgi:hypothetical protein
LWQLGTKMAGAGRSVSSDIRTLLGLQLGPVAAIATTYAGKIVLSLCDFEQQQLGNTVVSGRLNVVNGLKRTNQIVSLGRS